MSLPYDCGASIRSGYICKYQKEFANVFVFTVFIYKTDKQLEMINGIPHFRMNNKISSLLRFYSKLLDRVRKVIFKTFNIYLGEAFEFPLSFFTKYYIKKLIKQYNIDLIHQYTQSSIGNYCLKVARKMNIPFVYSFRGFAEAGLLASANVRRLSDKKTIEFFYKRLKKDEAKILTNADYVSTMSEPMRKVLIGRGVDKDKILVIPNSIDNVLLSPETDIKLRDKLLLKGYYILGHFGRMREYEGIEILLQALRILLDHGLRVKLLLIGDVVPRYLDFLKTVIEDNSLENNVIFLDRMPHTEIGKYYNLVDAIVLPRLNVYECRMVTPLKPIDAMAYKTLVIASDLPALRYTITPYKTGILFEPEDSIDLSNKIIRCIYNPIRHGKIVNRAYDNVLQNFTWDSVVPRYEEVYKKLIKEVKK
jgi:glycosyltransferase involved in cell wall biosynthesis